MKIETSQGKTFEVKAICAMLTKPNRALIEMQSARPLGEIIPDFDGLTMIKKDMGSGVYEAYEGFNTLVGISRVDKNTVRITLERGE